MTWPYCPALNCVYVMQEIKVWSVNRRTQDDNWCRYYKTAHVWRRQRIWFDLKSVTEKKKKHLPAARFVAGQSTEMDEWVGPGVL